LVLLEMGHNLEPGRGVAAAQRVWAQNTASAAAASSGILGA
jgi:hypothetical protein